MDNTLAPSEPSTSRGSGGRSPQKSEKRHRQSPNSKANPLISPTEKCKICGEAAARHIHYGAVTCFSCRAFFRRSIQSQNHESYKCRRQENCEMNVKSRKSCQKCRFKKCLEIGMKSSWVLSEEERYRRFRKHREKVDKLRGQSREESADDDTAEGASASNTVHADFYPNDSSDEDDQWYSGNNSPSNFAVAVSPMQAKGQIINGLPPSFPPTHPKTEQPVQMFFGSHSISQQLPPSWNRTSQELSPIKDEPSDYESDDSDSDRLYYAAHLPNAPAEEITADELAQIKSIARTHDVNYKSVNFGEELIKEMVMSSVFGVPLSVSATMNAYRLMIQRVTKVAQGFDLFSNLPHQVQSTLLKNNADTIVSLRGAVFFEKRKKGFDQILITMGVDDFTEVRSMIMTAMQSTELKRIDYQTFNSLQQVNNSESEARYNTLLQRVGSKVSFDPDLVKILSYILLFTVDYLERNKAIRKAIEETQDSMITMMRRYIYAQYPRQMATKFFSGLLHCIADLNELTFIKKQRQLAAPATTMAQDKVMRDSSTQGWTSQPNETNNQNFGENFTFERAKET